MRKTIGIIGGSFKPFTEGHFFLIKKASMENSEVILFVSTVDRIRKNEVPIHFEGTMEKVWNNYLLPIMPKNVVVHFVRNPTSEVYAFLESGNADDNDHNTYVLYADDQDLPRYYPERMLIKHNPRLVQNNQIKKCPVVRATNVNISGTEMRNYIRLNDIVRFTTGLPKLVQEHGQDIFDILARVSECA